MSKRMDLTGKRFGKWTVIEFDGKDKCGNLMWKCQCDCGNYRVVQGASLTSGASKSCGCSKYVPLRRNDIKTYTRLYTIWHNMLRRCRCEKDEHYIYYGGRGITVCDEWANSFQTFQEWALSHGYQNNLSIDRIDNSKGYSPENCRWASTKEQNSNRRCNLFCEINGVRQTILEWANCTGIPAQTLYGRYHKGYRGKDLIKAVG